MDTNRRHRYEMIVLIDRLTVPCPHLYEGWEHYCEACSCFVDSQYLAWECPCCGHIYVLPHEAMKIDKYDLRIAHQMVRRISPKPAYPETNAEFAKRHGISRRQASKVRKFSREVLYWDI